MKRYTVKVRGTASTNVVVEAENEEQAKEQAEELVRTHRVRYTWGMEGVKVLGVKPYLWNTKDQESEE